MKLSSPLTKAIHLVPPGHADPAAQELRARFLIDETGYFSSPNQLNDAFDQQAGYILVKEQNGRCDALMRIIHSGDAGFDLERYINPRDYVVVTDQSIEVAELIIASDQRASNKTLQLALGFGGYLKLFAPDTLISLATKETASHYNRLGMTVRWDIKIRALTWNIDLWLCYARPATVILDHLIKNAPAIYRKTVDNYLESISREDFFASNPYFIR